MSSEPTIAVKSSVKALLVCQNSVYSSLLFAPLLRLTGPSQRSLVVTATVLNPNSPAITPLGPKSSAFVTSCYWVFRCLAALNPLGRQLFLPDLGRLSRQAGIPVYTLSDKLRDSDQSEVIAQHCQRHQVDGVLTVGSQGLTQAPFLGLPVPQWVIEAKMGGDDLLTGYRLIELLPDQDKATVLTDSCLMPEVHRSRFAHACAASQLMGQTLLEGQWLNGPVTSESECSQPTHTQQPMRAMAFEEVCQLIGRALTLC